ncbi:unnamed protein product [Peronospora destructor]|uniref:Uncharacterized protein n=1 Tax=Peronospora destructor TaxID=86335 RepID=A0AAV0VAL9_9STRA|nr:unnamed protein product [Peronospora destructor]
MGPVQMNGVWVCSCRKHGRQMHLMPARMLFSTLMVGNTATRMASCEVDEPAMCKYLIHVCVPSLCDTKSVKEYDFAENKENIGLCKETFETSHAHAKLPSTFSTLHWSSVISEDSSELDWARRLQFAN